MKAKALFTLILAGLLIGGCQQVDKGPVTPGSAGLAEGKQALAQAALTWAIVEKNIQDFQLIKHPTNVVVSSEEIGAGSRFVLRGVKVTVMTPAQIQKKADREGDFLYLRFKTFGVPGHKGPAFKIGKSEATVSIQNIWAISSESRKARKAYLSGGGAELLFKRRGSNWVFDHVVSHIVS